MLTIRILAARMIRVINRPMRSFVSKRTVNIDSTVAIVIQAWRLNPQNIIDSIAEF